MASTESRRLSPFAYLGSGMIFSSAAAVVTYHLLSLFGLDEVTAVKTEIFREEDYDYYVFGERYEERPNLIMHERVPESGATPVRVQRLSVAEAGAVGVFALGIWITMPTFLARDDEEMQEREAGRTNR